MKPSLVVETRWQKIQQVLARRQPDLRVFMERVVNHHNVSAILRTADAVGVLHVHYFHEGELPINDAVTCGAHQWLFLHREEDVPSALRGLKEEGYQIVATGLLPEALPFRQVDYSRPTVIVVGHELEGVSEEALREADLVVRIPMYGMVQSLNVSVATAVILYEAERQRREKGLYETPRLSPEEMEAVLEKWTYRDVLRKKSRGRVSSFLSSEQ